MKMNKLNENKIKTLPRHMKSLPSIKNDEIFVKPLTSCIKYVVYQSFFLGYVGINAKTKDINAIDELRSRFGKLQRETGNRLNFSISYFKYIYKEGNER